MSTYLVTGVPGAGKTTIAAALSDYGFDAIDMSRIAGLSSWIDDGGHTVIRPPRTTAAWLKVHRWTWDLEVLQAIITNHHSLNPLFLCGNARNMDQAYHLFDWIFYLKASKSTILERLQSPSRTSDFGRNDIERRQVLDWIRLSDVEMAKTQATIIDANRSVEEIMNSILGFLKIPADDHR